MRTLMEYLLDRVENQVNEAFKQSDYKKASDLLNNVIKRAGFEVFPGAVPMIIGNQLTASMVVRNAKKDTVVTINFYEGGSSMSPDSITVVAKDGLEFIFEIINNRGTYSTKGTDYNCAGVGIAAILKVVTRILENGGKADAAFEEYKEYFTLVESEIVDGEIVTEANIDYADEGGLRDIISDMEGQGKNKKQIGDFIYRLASKAKADGNDSAYDMLISLRKEVLGIVSNNAATGAVPTGAPTGSTPAPKEVSIKTRKMMEARDTAAFWLQKSSYETPSERMNKVNKLMKKFIVHSECNLAIFAGAPGVGKTFRVTEVLDHYGDEASTALEGKWTNISGSTSASQFYQICFRFRNPDNIILIDDADSFLDDTEAADLFKAATNSKSIRKISWAKSGNMDLSQEEFDTYEAYCDDLEAHKGIRSERARILREPRVQNGITIDGKYNYPKSFYFQGRIIILTNKGFSEYEPAILDRAIIKLDLSFTDEELMELVEEIAPHVQTVSGLDIPDDVREWTIGYLKDKVKEITQYNEDTGSQARLEVSIRSYQNAATLAFMGWPDKNEIESEIRDYFLYKAGGEGHK